MKYADAKMLTMDMTAEMLATDACWARAMEVMAKAKQIQTHYEGERGATAVRFHMPGSHGFLGADYLLDLRTSVVRLVTAEEASN